MNFPLARPMLPRATRPDNLASSTWIRLLLVLLVALSLVAALVLIFGGTAQAASITVTTAVDELADNGACSLREAITNANADAATHPDCAAGSGADVITLPAGIFANTIPGNAEDVNASGDLDVNSTMTIAGAGVGVTIIDGGGLDRVFDLFGSTDAIIEDLTIRNGSAPFGAGVNARVASQVVFNRVSVENNSVTSAANNGGAVHTSNAQVTFNESQIINNTTAGANGGGIDNVSGSVLTLNNSTVSGNNAGGGGSSGGGINNFNATVIINNSTISGNTAGVDDGIRTWGAGGNTLSISHSTLVGSNVLLHVQDGTSLVQIDHSIIKSDPGNAACSGNDITSLDYNIATDNSCNLDAIHDQPDTDPLLGGLTANGGPTQTHVLGIDSPATNAGDPTRTTPATDQRGFLRVEGGIIDIGAFELGITTLTVNNPTDTLDTTPGDGLCADGSGNCTLRAAIGEANALSDIQTIVLPAGFYQLTLPGVADNSNATGDLDITGPVTILGDGATTTIVDGGGLDRVFETRPGAGLVTMLGLTIQNGDGDGTWPNGIGGGFFNGSTRHTVLEDVEIRDNGQNSIYNFNSTLTLERVTVAGNAGIIQIDGNDSGAPGARALLNVINSTISGNGSGAGNAGAINVTINGGGLSDLTVRNSTIVGNDALGIRAPNALSVIDVSNSILTANSLNECFSPIDSGSGNLIDDATCAAGNTPATNVDLTLAANGGETRTHALLIGSNAIDAVSCQGLTVDQRGSARPVGVTCDTGAFEFAPAQPGPIFTVNSTDDVDDGACSVDHCSLREAILAANARPNDATPDEIHFNIPGGGVQTITPTTTLPEITDAVVVDGYTQPGATPNTLAVGNDATLLIELNGVLVVSGTKIALINNADGSTFRGIVFTDWGSGAITLQTGAANNTIAGNFIGVDATGNGDRGGLSDAVTIAGDNNVVGGTSPADRNVISNYSWGMTVIFGSGNDIHNNYIGTNAAGTVALPNATGIRITADNNYIGGSNPGEGNLIVSSTGIEIDLATAFSIFVRGNQIGTDVNGNPMPGNAGGTGMVLKGGVGNITIGGYGASSGNLIAGHNDGIWIEEANGVMIRNNAIRDNAGVGIVLRNPTSYGGPAAQRIEIFDNAIFNNGGLGIDLNEDGISPIDFGDGDGGPNGGQNAPILQRAIVSDTVTTVQGFINTTPNTGIEIQLFANTTCDSSFYGEGETPLATDFVTTNSLGYASFLIEVSPGIPTGAAITALASSGDGETGYITSEFSRCTVVGPNNDTWVNAFSVPLLPVSNDQVTGNAQQYLTAPGQTRWFRFPVGPDSRVIVDLDNLPANYDLTLFRDIAQTYAELGAPQDRDDLVLLNAEFAPEMFTPEMFTPEMFTPEMFTPEMFTPEMFTPEMFTPEMFTPEMFTPEMFTPEMFTPEMFTPEMFTPEMFTPEMFTPEMFTPEMFTPEMFTPEMFTPDQRYFAGAQAKSAVAVSGFDGTAPETVTANTWSESGDWYVSVRGRNGAFDPIQPFDLNVTVLGAECVNVTDFTFTPDVGNIPAGSAETLFLVDSVRFAGFNQIQSQLNTLADATNGVVVDLNTFPEIQSAHAQADANFGCVYAKNLLAYAIKDLVDAYRAQNPGLKYIVLVGNDEVIPFFRYPDLALLANESGYTPPVDDQTSSQASLRNNYFLSQDTYGASVEIERRNTSLPVPELAVGRLVETPSDILSTIAAFTSTNGTVPTPSSALVTGYDFLDDAANAVDGELAAGLGINGTVNRLVDASTVAPADGWTAEDLRTAFLESGRHDMVFLAGHFSAFSALAADYETRLLASEILASPVDMTNAIIFSNGCHSGYNIVNEHGIPNVTVEPDWAQAFAAKGALLIGGTGYQYGDTDFIEYSERLYVEFSRELRRGTDPVSVGDALVRAKQVYLADTANMRPIHEKALLISTIFGLPMLTVDMPGERYKPDPLPGLVTGTAGYTTDPGLTLGLTFADVTVSPSITPVVKSLYNVVDDSSVDTVYYAPADATDLVINPGEPVLPVERYAISTPGTVVRGVGFRGGSFSDVANQIPLVGAATTELRSIHVPFISPVHFPIKPWDVNYFDQLANSADTGITSLAVLPVQYLSNGPESVDGTLRVYDDMAFRFFYSGNTASYTNAAEGITNIPALAGPPTLPKILATTDGTGNVIFEVTALADPSAGVQEVWVTFTGESGSLAGSWQSLDLTQNPDDSRLWTGTLALDGTSPTPPQDLRFMVQAVNGVGLVGLATNKGAYYVPDVDAADPATPPGSTVAPAPVELTLLSPAVNGDYGTSVAVSARLTSNGTPLAGERLEFGLTTQRQTAVTDENGVATATLTLINEAGEDTLRVTYPGAPGLSATGDAVTFTINPSPTTLSLTTETPTFGLNGRADITLLLTDGTGRPLREKSVLILVKDGGGSVVFAESAITNLLGQPVLRSAELVPGAYTVEAYFGSLVPVFGKNVDLRTSRYLPSSASLDLIQNTPPVANAGGPYSVPEGGTVILDAGGSTDVNLGQALAFTWDLNSVGGFEATGVTVTLSAAELDGPDSVTVSVQVCDPVEECSTASATLEVTNVDPTLTSVSNDGPVGAGQPVTISVAATDAVDDLLYSFDCGNDGIFEIGPQNSPAAQCTLAGAGVQTVAVQVDDGDGGVVTGSTAVTVEYVDPPTVDAGTDRQLFQGDTAALEADFSANGLPGPFTFTWDFGDGTPPASGQIQNHIYTQPGTFAATVQVFQDSQLVAEDSLAVTVLNGLFRYCVFATDGDLSVHKEGELTNCPVGATGKVNLHQDVSITGGVESRGEEVKVHKNGLITGKVWAAGKVELSDGAQVDGDVQAGGEISLKQNATVNGAVTAYAMPPFGPISPVVLALTHGDTDIKIDKQSVEELPPGDYAKLEVKDNATVALRSGHYRFEEIKVKKDVTLTFDLANGPIIIDVTDKIDLGDSVSMSATGGDATGILIRSTGDKIKLGKQGVYLGTFLAPHAEVELGDSSSLTGALFGSKIQIKKSSQLICALALDLLTE